MVRYSVPRTHTSARYADCFILLLRQAPLQSGHLHPNFVALLRALHATLYSISDWHIQFKCIIRHHSSLPGNELRFDTRLLQEHLIPNTYTAGFTGPIFSTTGFRISTLREAHAYSQLITQTVGNFSLHQMSQVIQEICFEPGTYLWTVENPFKLTLAGCYAGAREDDHEEGSSLIEKMCEELHHHMSFSVIRVMGAVNWTFYASLREISAFESYLEPPDTKDPFRGARRAEEVNLYVHASPHIRRFLTRIAVYVPLRIAPTTLLAGHAYGVRGPHVPGQTTITCLRLDPNVESYKRNILNVLIQTLLYFYKRTGTPLLRIPPDLTFFIRNFGEIISTAFTVDILEARMLDALRYLRSCVETSRTVPVNLHHLIYRTIIHLLRHTPLSAPSPQISLFERHPELHELDVPYAGAAAHDEVALVLKQSDRILEFVDKIVSIEDICAIDEDTESTSSTAPGKTTVVDRTRD